MTMDRLINVLVTITPVEPMVVVGLSAAFADLGADWRPLLAEATMRRRREK
jgi:hypothetical protein